MAELSITAQRLSRRAQALKTKMNEEQKCALAQEMGNALSHESLNDNEQAIALEIITKLIEDQIDSVRVAVAASVAGSSVLPAGVAQQLANDISEVAIPVLRLSPVLEEKFLGEIINSGVVDKISAIAERENLSENLARKIVASGKTPSVVKLIKNPSAHITDQTIVTIIRVYGDHHKIEQSLFDRDCLNDDLINSLRKLTESHVETFLKRYFNLPENAFDVEHGKKLIKRNESQNEDGEWWHHKKGVV